MGMNRIVLEPINQEMASRIKVKFHSKILVLAPREMKAARKNVPILTWARTGQCLEMASRKVKFRSKKQNIS
jgi:hypothetical protein